MKISIITPSFNQGKFIEKNIKSIFDQNYPNFEHIIVDGGSTDDTVEILKKYSHLKWVSEPDEGQADALNKGLKMASGDIIGWLNSDDYYLPNAFNIVSETYLNEKWDWLIGNLKYYYKLKNEFVEVISHDLTYDKLIVNPDIVCQQSTFFSKTTLLKVGGWKKEYQMIMDYELWLRLIKLSQPKIVNEFLAVFVWHEEQKSIPINIIVQKKELLKLLKKEKVNLFIRIKISFKKNKIFVIAFLKQLFNRIISK